MSGGELDDLARLWRQEPTSEEASVFAALARRTGRRAWLLDKIELGTTVVLSIGIFLYLLLYGNPVSVLVGGVIVVAIIWSTLRRHRLLEASRLTEHGTCVALLEAAVRSAEASVRRSTIGTALLLPGFVLGTLLKYSLREGGTLVGYLAAEVSSWSTSHGRVSHAIVLIALVYLVRMNLRLRRELVRVRKLRDEYLEEARLDASA